MRARILVVDDEPSIRTVLKAHLSRDGHEVLVAPGGAEAVALLSTEPVDLVISDLKMPGMDGMELLAWCAREQPGLPVIVITAHGTIDTAVEATKHGAIAFLEKPITLQKLLRAVEQALARNAPRPPAPPPLPAWTRAEASYVAPLPPLTALGSHGGMPMHGGPSPEQLFHLDRPLREARDAFEKSYFEFHLAKENGSMTRVAEKTGLERTHLYRKLKQLGVDIARSKRSA